MAYENEMNLPIEENELLPAEDSSTEVAEIAEEPLNLMETAETGTPEVDPVLVDTDEVELAADDDDLLADGIADELDIDFEFEGEPKKANPLTEKVQEKMLQVRSDVQGKVQQVRSDVQEKVQQVRSDVQVKYAEARTACRDLMDRLSKDLEETNYNPYIRSTTTHKYEILRSADDTEPVDVFEFEKTAGYSLRAMAITSAIVVAADLAVAKLLKKKLF